MDTEIELKYLVLGDNISAVISKLLNLRQFSFSKKIKHLSNCYFDTPDLQLRKADIGLRVRKNADGDIEQTIKTSGTTIGGLHQRPEYNIALQDEMPDLSLFDSSIWPAHVNLVSLQQQLTPLFNTDFTRTAWLITGADNSQIELAFDQGKICSSQKTDTICEIELELVSGNTAALFSLAQTLMTELALRPGTQSKAARGYGLVFGYTQPHISSANSVLPLHSSMSVQQSFNKGFAECLAQLQQLVSQFVEHQTLSLLKEISDSLAMARHGLWLYKDYLTSPKAESIRLKIKAILTELAWVETAKQIKQLTTQKGNYRKKIEYSESLLATLKDEKLQPQDFDQVLVLLHGEQFNLLQLEMLELVYSGDSCVNAPCAKAPCSNDSVDRQTSLMDLAPSWLAINLDNIKKSMPANNPLTAKDYIDNHYLIIHSLLTGNWFGDLYDVDERMDYRGPWLDIHFGIDELETLFLLKEHLHGSSEEMPQKLILWLDDKMENLLCAVEHCRKAALNLSPYWLR
ncbi:hypothetical protein A9Q98_02245 [Thalassotalea sp. 42_200_T64]|nr:hypothetical protein A9Q98_02245 [Thalassotalea sp. 42_200_T64]